MSHAYTTTAHHFGECAVNSVHRKWISHRDVEICFERRESGGRRGDEVTLHVSGQVAKKLCKSLLNIIGNDHDFHEQLEQMMRVQRTPE